MLFFMFFFIYFVFPALYGQYKNVRLSPQKRVWFSHNLERLRRWRSTEYSATVFMATTTIFFIVGLCMISGVKFSNKFLISILAVNCLAALSFLFFYWEVAKYWVKYGAFLKILIVPAALFITALSKIYSDSGIAELSGLAPQDLPGAQIFLTLIFTPVIWLIIISLAAGYFSLLLMPALMLLSIFHDIPLKVKSSNHKDGGIGRIIALAAVAIFAIFSLTIMQKIVSKNVYEPRIRQAIVFSSFHLPTTFCGFPDIKDVYLAPMLNNRAALAIPDRKKAYKFVPIACRPAVKSEDEILRHLKELGAVENTM